MTSTRHTKITSEKAFVNHLRRCAHKPGENAATRLNCSHCGACFTLRSALLGHMETSNKCHIRHQEAYGRAVGKLTGNILNVVRPTAENIEDLGEDRPFAELGLYRIVVDKDAYKGLVGEKGQGREEKAGRDW